MILKKLESLYNWIDNLGPRIKTTIIVMLLGAVLYVCHIQYLEYVIDQKVLDQGDTKSKAEDYVKDKSHDINHEVTNILEKDLDASNVILLNYHNTLTSSHGLSYRFLTALTEKRRGINTVAQFKHFKELDYVNYGDEIEKINQLKYLRVDSINEYKESFPNFTDILEISKCQQAALYPIHGQRDYIGMIIILYNRPKKYELGYYQKVLHEPIQNLAILLDYNSYLKNNKIN